MKSRTFVFGFGITCVLFAAGCAQQPPAGPPATRAADEQALKDADAAWSKAAATPEGFLSYYTDDVTVLAPNAPTISGKAAATPVIQEMYKAPAFQLKWEASKVEVANSGDIGYARGTYEVTQNDATGKAANDKGKFLEVWKKQADGSWKCIVDAFSSDLPAAPATPTK